MSARYVRFMVAVVFFVLVAVSTSPAMGGVAPGLTERVSTLNFPYVGDPVGTSTFCDVTPDSRYVVFRSNSTQLTDDDSNAYYDIYLRDRLLNRTERNRLLREVVPRDPRCEDLALDSIGVVCLGQFAHATLVLPGNLDACDSTVCGGVLRTCTHTKGPAAVN